MQADPSSFLLIFDCDGVLVDSEPLSNRIFNTMLGELGIVMSLEETVEKYVGRSMKSCYEMIYQEYGVEVPPEFNADYQQRIKQVFVDQLQAVSHIHETLAILPYPRCVASSGSHEKMQTTLGVTGLYAHFEGRIFSATEVQNGKPAPDLFLYAAAAMGVVPERCIVIEDSVPGIQAALTAGMKALGYAERSPAHKLEQAGATVFKSMKELPAIVQTIMQA